MQCSIFRLPCHCLQRVHFLTATGDSSSLTKGCAALAALINTSTQQQPAAAASGPVASLAAALNAAAAPSSPPALLFIALTAASAEETAAVEAFVTTLTSALTSARVAFVITAPSTAAALPTPLIQQLEGKGCKVRAHSLAPLPWSQAAEPVAAKSSAAGGVEAKAAEAQQQGPRMAQLNPAPQGEGALLQHHEEAVSRYSHFPSNSPSGAAANDGAAAAAALHPGASPTAFGPMRIATLTRVGDSGGGSGSGFGSGGGGGPRLPEWAKALGIAPPPGFPAPSSSTTAAAASPPPTAAPGIQFARLHRAEGSETKGESTAPASGFPPGFQPPAWAQALGMPGGPPSAMPHSFTGDYMAGHATSTPTGPTHRGKTGLAASSTCSAL